MTHKTLQEILDALGWRRQDFPSGTVDYHLSGHGPCDRLIRMIPDEPERAMCQTRGVAARSVTTLAEAAAWARECMPCS